MFFHVDAQALQGALSHAVQEECFILTFGGKCNILIVTYSWHILHNTESTILILYDPIPFEQNLKVIQFDHFTPTVA